MNKIIDIQSNHSYSDYRRFFGYKYDKGKLLGFTKDQYEYMNPNRQYWEMKDENGVTKYFELPKYVKPFTNFSPYCFNALRHSRPTRNALYILGGLVVASISCSFIAQKFFGTNNFDEHVDAAKLDECAVKYYNWKKDGQKDPTVDDITKDVKSVATLAGMAMGNFLYETISNPGVATLRDNALAVAHGHNDTNIIISHVLVDISNNFQQIGGVQMEEAVSCGSMSLTRFGRRDYFNENGDKKVYSYHGTPSSNTEVKWDNKSDKNFTEKEYLDLVGKNPAQPFLYDITNETVLTDTVYDEDYDTGEKHYGNSSCVAIKENNKIKGYKIELDLHNVKSITRYVKRMTYLSGQTPNRFNTIHMSFETDENLILRKSYVQENYVITMMQSEGWLDTRYYVGEKETKINKITPPGESFDYSKYTF